MVARAWLPSDALTPLVCWIDPNDESTLTRDSQGRVLRATDKSGNGNSFGVMSGGTGPTSAIVNGLTAFTDNVSGGNFSLTAKLVSATSGLNALTQGDNTLACIAAPLGSAANFAMMGFGCVTPLNGASSRAYSWEGNGANVPTSFFRHGASSFSGGIVMAQGGSVAVQTRSGAAVVGYVDGVQANTSTSGTGFTAETGAWRINGWATADISNGNIAPLWTGDCVAYRGVLGADDRQRLEGYLAWKWGTQGQLASSHPYRNAAPTVAYNAYTQAVTAASAAGIRLGFAAGKGVLAGVGATLMLGKALARRPLLFSTTVGYRLGRLYAKTISSVTTTRPSVARSTMVRLVAVGVRAGVGLTAGVVRSVRLSVMAPTLLALTARFFAYGLPAPERIVTPLRRIRTIFARRR